MANKSAKKADEPTTKAVQDFVGLLKMLAPAASDSMIWDAADYAMRWVDRYHSQLKGPGPGTKEWLAERAKAKQQLLTLSKTLTRLQLQIETLCNEAKRELPGFVSTVIRLHLDEETHEFVKCTRFTGIRTSLEDLCTINGEWRNYISYKLRTMSVKPRRSKHTNPVHHLACGIHQTISMFLRLTPAMTREWDPINGKPTAANYARLLSAAIKLGGGTPPDDLLPIMRVGRRLDTLSPAGVAAWSREHAP